MKIYSKFDTSLNEKDLQQLIKNSSKNEVKHVVLTSSVLLNLVNDCFDKFPNSIQGLLLGLKIDSTLEITTSFPLIPTDEEKDDEEEDYQSKFLQCLQEINCDNNIVGWYQTIIKEKFLNTHFIETQYQYQKEHGKNCICLLIDTQRTKNGRLHMKAVRLTDKFMTILKKRSKRKPNITRGIK